MAKVQMPGRRLGGRFGRRFEVWAVVGGMVGCASIFAACATQSASDGLAPSKDAGRADATLDGTGADSTVPPSFGDAGGDAMLDVTSDTPSIPIDDGGGDGTDEASPDSGDTADGPDATPDARPLPDASADGGCGAAPILHPGNGSTLYCPFGLDGGGSITCNVGQQYCCVSGKVDAGYPLSDCEPVANGGCASVDAGVPGSSQIECEDPQTDCVSGSVCCGGPNSIQHIAACGYDKLVGFTHSKCEPGPSCGAGEFQICTGASECPVGQACVPFKGKLDLGHCQ